MPVMGDLCLYSNLGGGKWWDLAANEIEATVAKALFLEAFRKLTCHQSCPLPKGGRLVAQHGAHHRWALPLPGTWSHRPFLASAFRPAIPCFPQTRRGSPGRAREECKCFRSVFTCTGAILSITGISRWLHFRSGVTCMALPLKASPTSM